MAATRKTNAYAHLLPGEEDDDAWRDALLPDPEPAPPEPIDPNLSVGFQVTQAHLSVVPDPADACLVHLSGVVTTTEPGTVTYRFVVRDGALWLRIGSRRWEQLDATTKDEFIPHIREPADQRVMSFLRDNGGTVSGLMMDYYRVKGVLFERRSH